MKQSFYICYNKDNNIVKKSSSGGIFYTISSLFFEKYKKVKVYGCALNDDLEAIHMGVEKIKDITPLLGSKYISSNISGIYQEVMEDLTKGYIVLFCGTPCQISALNNIIKTKKIDTEKLYTLDFVCHGVSNNDFFKDYIKYLEKKYKGKAKECNFRTKSKPGKLQDMSVYFDNNKKYLASTTKLDWFYSAYHKNLSIKQQCFKCPFTNLDRNSDITMGDAWGSRIEGCWSPSLIIINTAKGSEIYKHIKKFINYKEVTLSEIHNPQLYKNIEKPDNYDEFNKVYKEKGFFEAQKFIGNNTFWGKIKLICANIIYYFK